MDLQQTIKNKWTLIVIGDPIIDEYIYGTISGQRFTPISRIEKPGGAINVLQNLTSLFGEGDIEATQDYYFDPYILTRYIADNKVIFEVPRYEMQRGSTTHYSLDRDVLEVALIEGNIYTGIIISDYNKGSANRFVPELDDILRDKVNFLIVDSRYGTYNKQYLDYANCKILHVTGEELNLHTDLDRFDFIIHTNGPGKVCLYKPSKIIPGLECIEIFDVPDTKVVDTTGAGDTFVASIAASLASTTPDQWTLDYIRSAVRLAITHCQQVIRIWGTGVAYPI